MIRRLSYNAAAHRSPPYRNAEEIECRDELLALPMREDLVAECTSTALLLYVQTVRAAIDTADPNVSTALADFDNTRSLYAPSRLAKSITRVLEEYLRFRDDRPKEMTIIVSGDKGEDMLITEVISEAVRGFELEPYMLADETVFIATRGAAQLACRAVERPTARAGSLL
ncbi:MAG: hypothetical protein Q9160_005279 [Pyrenula sp. 1 TL-2023]